VPHRSSQHEQAEYERLARVKQVQRHDSAALGPEMLGFFKQAVQKRQAKLTKIAECWSVLVPAPISEHCALESLNRGTLTVLVDSSPHLYDLKQLLLAGLEEQLLLACRTTGLRKIALRPGRWYEAGDEGGSARPRFG
jgi:hypothetical protein